ncbi:hypothetical protein T10_13157, partial [Trichinella papuae]
FIETDDNYESINCCLNFKNCPSQKQKGDDRPAKITWPCQREPLEKPCLVEFVPFPTIRRQLAELENYCSDVVRCADVVVTVIRISCAATASSRWAKFKLSPDRIGICKSSNKQYMQTSKACRQDFDDAKMQLQKLKVPLSSDSIWKYVNEVHFLHFEFVLHAKSVPLNQLMTNFHSIDSAISNKRVPIFVKPHSPMITLN